MVIPHGRVKLSVFSFSEISGLHIGKPEVSNLLLPFAEKTFSGLTENVGSIDALFL